MHIPFEIPCFLPCVLKEYITPARSVAVCGSMWQCAINLTSKPEVQTAQHIPQRSHRHSLASANFGQVAMVGTCQCGAGVGVGSNPGQVVSKFSQQQIQTEFISFAKSCMVHQLFWANRSVDLAKNNQTPSNLRSLPLTCYSVSKLTVLDMES